MNLTSEQKEQANRYLAKCLGKCWHKVPKSEQWEIDDGWSEECLKCGELIPLKNYNPDYFSDSGFMTILREAKKSKGWFDFVVTMATKKMGHPEIVSPPYLNYLSYLPRFLIDLIDPDIFAWEFAKWLGMKEE